MLKNQYIPVAVSFTMPYGDTHCTRDMLFETAISVFIITQIFGRVNTFFHFFLKIQKNKAVFRFPLSASLGVSCAGNLLGRWLWLRLRRNWMGFAIHTSSGN
jgi:hypothetical protein